MKDLEDAKKGDEGDNEKKSKKDKKDKKTKKDKKSKKEKKSKGKDEKGEGGPSLAMPTTFMEWDTDDDDDHGHLNPLHPSPRVSPVMKNSSPIGTRVPCGRTTMTILLWRLGRRRTSTIH